MHTCFEVVSHRLMLTARLDFVKGTSIARCDGEGNEKLDRGFVSRQTTSCLSKKQTKTKKRGFMYMIFL